MGDRRGTGGLLAGVVWVMSLACPAVAAPMKLTFVVWGNDVPYPAGPYGHRNVGGHDFFAISSQSKNPELAYQFIRYSFSLDTVRNTLAGGAVVTPVRRAGRRADPPADHARGGSQVPEVAG